MHPDRRWNRQLLHATFAFWTIAVTFQGISQHQHPESDASGHGHHSHDGAGESGGHGLHHDFSDVERWTKIFDSEERTEWQQPAEVVTSMEIENGMTVADLGAGTGFFLSHLAAAVGVGGKVLALDPEPNLVAFMERRVERQGLDNVEVRRIPYDDPGVEDSSVDRVLIVNTWHHIDSRPDYAAKLLRALKPGGAVYVVDFTMDSPSGPPQEHRLPPEQILEELEAGGLQARQIEEHLPRQFIVVGSKGSDGG